MAWMERKVPKLPLDLLDSRVSFCNLPVFCLLFRCAQCVPAKEIAAVDQVSATFECKLLAEDFGGETVYCKACEGKLQSLSCKVKDFPV